MTNEMKKGFAARVAQANRSELIVITYDVMIELMKEAKLKEQKEEWEAYRSALSKSRQFLNELMGSLDYEYEISISLMAHYIYMDKQIVRAMAEKQSSFLLPVEEILDKFRQAFMEVAKQDISASVMSNTQEVYAGLTYGRGSLNESVSGQENRGFKA